MGSRQDRRLGEHGRDEIWHVLFSITDTRSSVGNAKLPEEFRDILKSVHVIPRA